MDIFILDAAACMEYEQICRPIEVILGKNNNGAIRVNWSKTREATNCFVEYIK